MASNFTNFPFLWRAVDEILNHFGLLRVFTHENLCYCSVLYKFLHILLDHFKHFLQLVLKRWNALLLVSFKEISIRRSSCLDHIEEFFHIEVAVGSITMLMFLAFVAHRRILHAGSAWPELLHKVCMGIAELKALNEVGVVIFLGRKKPIFSLHNELIIIAWWCGFIYEKLSILNNQDETNLCPWVSTFLI